MLDVRHSDRKSEPRDRRSLCMEKRMLNAGRSRVIGRMIGAHVLGNDMMTSQRAGSKSLCQSHFPRHYSGSSSRTCDGDTGSTTHSRRSGLFILH